MHYRVLSLLAIGLLLALSWAMGLAQAPTSSPVFRQTQQAGELSVTLTVTALTGEQGVLVHVQDSAGQPVADASVVLSFVMPARTMNTPAVSAVHSISGRYDAGIAFSMEGVWQILVAVTTAGGAKVVAPFELEVRPGTPLPARPAPSLTAALLTSWTILAAGLLLVGLLVLALTQWLLKRRKAAGFSAGWLLLLGSLSSCVVPYYLSAARPNPVEATEASIERARPLYEQSCLPCHGPTGRGDGVAARTLNPRPADLTASHVEAHPDGQIFTWIRDGFPGSAMPAFGQQLSSDQIWDLVNYVRSFR